MKLTVFYICIVVCVVVVVVGASDGVKLSLPKPSTPGYLFEHGSGTSRSGMVRGVISPVMGKSIRWYNITLPPKVSTPLYINALVRSIKINDSFIPELSEEDRLDPEMSAPMKSERRFLCIDLATYKNVEEVYSKAPEDNISVRMTSVDDVDDRVFSLPYSTDSSLGRTCFDYEYRGDTMCASAPALASDSELSSGMMGGRVAIHCGFEDYECQFKEAGFTLFLSLDTRDLCALAREQESAMTAEERVKLNDRIAVPSK